MPDYIYAFRRKGQEDFCTCDIHRYTVFSRMPDKFEVTVFCIAEDLDSLKSQIAILKGLLLVKNELLSRACQGLISLLARINKTGLGSCQIPEYSVVKETIAMIRKELN